MSYLPSKIFASSSHSSPFLVLPRIQQLPTVAASADIDYSPDKDVEEPEGSASMVKMWSQVRISSLGDQINDSVRLGSSL